MNEPTIIPYILRKTAAYYCDKMREVSGHDPTEESRRRPVVVARTLVAYRLLLQGFTEHAVGAVLGWDHATIHRYFYRAYDMLKLPGYEAERELYDKFNQAIL